MGETGPWNIEGLRFADSRLGAFRDERKLCRTINKPHNQPRTGHSINPHIFPREPLHWGSFLSCLFKFLINLLSQGAPKIIPLPSLLKLSRQRRPVGGSLLDGVPYRPIFLLARGHESVHEILFLPGKRQVRPP